jgi:hypothetical protein
VISFRSSLLPIAFITAGALEVAVVLHNLIAGGRVIVGVTVRARGGGAGCRHAPTHESLVPASIGLNGWQELGRVATW